MSAPRLLAEADLPIQFHAQHLRSLERAGKFPRRISLTRNEVRWIADEVDAWLTARVAASVAKREPARELAAA